MKPTDILKYSVFGLLGGFVLYPWAHELQGFLVGLHAVATAAWLIWLFKSVHHA